MTKISKAKLDEIFCKGESGWKGQARLRRPQKPPKVRKVWTYNGDGALSASTKSEARAMAKRMLGLKRLPVGARVDLVK